MLSGRPRRTLIRDTISGWRGCVIGAEREAAMGKGQMAVRMVTVPARWVLDLVFRVWTWAGCLLEAKGRPYPWADFTAIPGAVVVYLVLIGLALGTVFLWQWMEATPVGRTIEASVLLGAFYLAGSLGLRACWVSLWRKGFSVSALVLGLIFLVWVAGLAWAVFGSQLVETTWG